MLAPILQSAARVHPTIALTRLSSNRPLTFALTPFIVPLQGTLIIVLLWEQQIGFQHLVIVDAVTRPTIARRFCNATRGNKVAIERLDMRSGRGRVEGFG